MSGDRARSSRSERLRRTGPLDDVDHADHDGGLSGPFVAAAGGVDRAAVRADPAQAGRSRVALGDRVGGDQAERPPCRSSVNARRKKWATRSAVAVRLGVDRLEPIEIAVGVAVDDRVLAGERRVADDRIEARILAGRTPPGTRSPSGTGDRMRPAAKVASRAPSRSAARASASPTARRASRPDSRRFLSRFRSLSPGEEGGDDQVADERAPGRGSVGACQLLRE